MAYSARYGHLAIPEIGEDEPVFVLRAQDELAESAIEMYRLLAEAHGCQLSPALHETIRHFQEWHGEKKLPVA